jgi:hypothetical protein
MVKVWLRSALPSPPSFNSNNALTTHDHSGLLIMTICFFTRLQLSLVCVFPEHGRSDRLLGSLEHTGGPASRMPKKPQGPVHGSASQPFVSYKA